MVQERREVGPGAAEYLYRKQQYWLRVDCGVELLCFVIYFHSCLVNRNQ